MNVLYDRTLTRSDEYHYQINRGGELYIKTSGNVVIRFENGKFKSCSFPFTGLYTREHWHILAGIAAEIEELESQYR